MNVDLVFKELKVEVFPFACAALSFFHVFRLRILIKKKLLPVFNKHFKRAHSALLLCFQLLYSE